MLKGVDISKYQGDVNFDALKQAVNFVIIKASSGAPDPGQTVAQYTDGKFTRNRDEARRVGLLRGFYHYGYPEYNSPEAEAQCFHDVVGTPQDGELLILDYESSWSGNKVDWCKRFLDKLSSLYSGYKPLIYLNLATTKGNDWSSVINGNYGLWLAQWDYNANAPMNPNTPWPFLAMRQYSNKENIAGINPVDGDVFYGDAAAFERYGYHAPAAPPPPPAPPQAPPDPPKEDPKPDPTIELNNQINGLKDEIAGLNDTIARDATDKTDLTNQIVTLKGQVNTLNATIADQEDQIHRLENQPAPDPKAVLQTATLGELWSTIIDHIFKKGDTHD